MRILFINPPWITKDGREGVRAGSRWPYTVPKLTKGETVPFPFYLAYSAALLRDAGHEVGLFDGVAARMKEEEFFKKLDETNPSLIVTETSTPSFNYDMGIIKQIKTSFPEAKIAIAGPHASFFTENILKGYGDIDFILLGEYEFTLRELVDAIETSKGYANILGIAYRDNSSIKINPHRPLIHDLDSLPFPARDLTPIYNYNDCFCKEQPNVQIHSSRGCVFECPFCVWPTMMYGGQNYRMRRPESVVDEMESIIRDYPEIKEFYFDDDTFTINKKHVLGICDEIKRRELKITWSCMGNTAKVTKDMLEQMRLAGCEGIKFGVETGDEEILKSLHKGTTLDEIRNVFRWCRELGIRTHATFTLGLPGETKETMKKSIDFLIELSPDSMQVSHVVPFPGTKMFAEAKDRGWIATEDWSLYDGTHSSVVKLEKITDEDIREAYEMALERWGWHQCQRAMKSGKIIWLIKAGIKKCIKGLGLLR